MPRAVTIRLMNELTNSANIEIVHIDTRAHKAAWKLLCGRPDKLWSLVDCASFVIMKDRGITDALTTDHHFEQAGFNILLK
jgi:predicted nucleic acid-binding protein